MADLVFSIKDVFEKESRSGCLQQHGCVGYHIPAYQRGYKWGAEKDDVGKLLEDLYKAFIGKKPEYYLQYATLKLISLEKSQYLEVIDGQQRLTTLSIIVAVMSSALNQNNFTAGKLDYAVRANFFSEWVYDQKALLQLLNEYGDWNSFIQEDDNRNKQDIYYLFKAIKSVNTYYKNMPENERKPFFEYLSNNSKLIINLVDSHLASERIFKNLNSNKVALTNTELIKGLLITKIGRSGKNGSFEEIQEKRVKIGLYWDEMSTWANRAEDIRPFFFNNSQDGMNGLLSLTVPETSRLFDAFEQISDEDWPAQYNKLRSTYQTLKDWYNTDDIYHLIGYIGSCKGGTLKLREWLNIADKKALKDTLREDAKKLYATEVDLTYGHDNNKIHNILLALSVFAKEQKQRFNFYAFSSEKWSLEHIFPQTPEGKKHTLTATQRKAVQEMLQESTEEVKAVLQKETRTEEEQEIYHNALSKHGELNSIGNLCLLRKEDNSSNGNLFFDEKRANVLRLLQMGSFVPKHTFDVFSKMNADYSNADLSVWSKTDIKEHRTHILASIAKLHQS